MPRTQGFSPARMRGSEGLRYEHVKSAAAPGRGQAVPQVALPTAALVALAMWIYIFVSAPAAGIVFSAAFRAVAVGAYAVFEKKNGRSSFEERPSRILNS